MKRIAFVGGLIVLVVMGAVVLRVMSSPVSADEAASDSSSETITSAFLVEGMTCGGCETGVRMAVKKLDGVEDVKASYEQGRAEVTYEATKVTTDQIIAAIGTLGYKSTLAPPTEHAG